MLFTWAEGWGSTRLHQEQEGGAREHESQLCRLPVVTRLDIAVRPSPRCKKGQRLARWICSLPVCLGTPFSSFSRSSPSHKIPTLVHGLGVFHALSFTSCRWFLPN